MLSNRPPRFDDLGGLVIYPKSTVMKYGFLSLLLLSLISTAFGQKRPSHTFKNEDGIYFEVFDTSVQDDSRYNWNNEVFKEGVTFKYDFYHLNESGEKFLFELRKTADKREDDWHFVPYEERDSNTIQQFTIKVLTGVNSMTQYVPEYDQTVILFNYYTTTGKKATLGSMSGAVENEKNIWIHPPRDRYFRILELNPFPFIYKPYKKGEKWKWELGIGDSWGDERWKTWEGGIKNKYKYKITDLRKVDTPFGELECYEVTGEAKSKIGKTKLVALFHPKYGYVSLDYTNIDGSKTICTLVERTKN